MIDLPKTTAGLCCWFVAVLGVPAFIAYFAGPRPWQSLAFYAVLMPLFFWLIDWLIRRWRNQRIRRYGSLRPHQSWKEN